MRLGKAAPLLARFLRAFGDEALASVDCDQRLRLPKPSSVGRSDDSRALLLLRLLWEGDPPARRKAISDVSPEPCDPIGSTELRSLSPGEVSEAVRLTVPTEELEADFERVDVRWCLVPGVRPGLPPAETVKLFMAYAVETRCRRAVV